MESKKDTDGSTAADVVHRVNPGSPEAIAEGCKCPQMDNSYGRGYHGQPGLFVYTHGCQLHWPKGRAMPGVYDVD